MSLIAFAKSELDHIGMVENHEDEMNRQMRAHILLMVQTFADEGHSGFSAQYALNCLTKLLAFEPLCPLTGEDSEWSVVEEGDKPLRQNKRCSRVFKSADGSAYDSEAIIFVDPEGNTYTSRDSKLDIKFPYTPTRKYVNVITPAEGTVVA